MKSILTSYSPKLTPSHGLIMETKQHLAAALGRVDGFRFDQMSVEDMELKISISEDLLKVLDVLEPGLSKSRGITLLDMAECKIRLIFTKYKSSAIEMYDELVKVEKELREAHDILQLEDENAIEGNVAKKARVDLSQLHQHLINLKKK